MCDDGICSSDSEVCLVCEGVGGKLRNCDTHAGIEIMWSCPDCPLLTLIIIGLTTSTRTSNRYVTAKPYTLSLSLSFPSRGYSLTSTPRPHSTYSTISASAPALAVAHVMERLRMDGAPGNDLGKRPDGHGGGLALGMLSNVQAAVSVGYSMDSETAQSATRTQARTGYERRNILMRIRSRDDYLRAREFCT
jgi:hypothetical protein